MCQGGAFHQDGAKAISGRCCRAGQRGQHHLRRHRHRTQLHQQRHTRKTDGATQQASCSEPLLPRSGSAQHAKQGCCGVEHR